jgi:hypothetical protein
VGAGQSPNLESLRDIRRIHHRKCHNVADVNILRNRQLSQRIRGQIGVQLELNL